MTVWGDDLQVGVEEMITLMTDEAESSDDLLPVRREAAAIDVAALAEELVASAPERRRADRESGLLTALTRQVVKTALQVEMPPHLGYDKHDPAGRRSPNSRNGSAPKAIRTNVGEVTIEVPRDRAGTFEPQIVRKYQRRLGGFDEAIISLYAKGMTTGT